MFKNHKTIVYITITIISVIVATALFALSISVIKDMDLGFDARDIPYEDRYTEYDVVSVFQYVKTETNAFGGVEKTNICYQFSYIDGYGSLKTVDDFENLEFGLTKLILSDDGKDKYIVDSIGSVRYLSLTKETLSKLTSSNQK